jgi:aerobic-type carbon monoxide dehydrogenase small subunit (CoxS/CutS family)
MEHPLSVTINGRTIERKVPATLRLVDFIRNDVGLTGTKVSCEAQVCGVCTILLDGLPISSCGFLAVDADGSEILTIEGMSDGRVPSEFQTALLRAGGTQCGYCTPGFVMTVEALSRSDREKWTENDVRHALEGNICRCTGYRQILDATCEFLGSSEHDSARECRGEHEAVSDV